MSIKALRLAVTNAGGTPTQYTHIGLLRELITAWGGTPSYFSTTQLLRQAITLKGGTPTQFNQTYLLRQLVTALGGTPVRFDLDALWDQIAGLAGSAPDTTAPTITSANPSGGYAEMAPVSGTLTADEAVTWSKSGADAARVTLNSATGAWTLETTDFETKTSYSWTFTATDLALNATNQNVAITITDVDEIPAAFAFTDVTGGTVSTQYTSNTITVSGLAAGVSVPVAVSGGTYSKNGGAYTSSAGTAANGDTFTVRQTSSASDGTATNVVLTIGGVSDTYTVTTAAGLNTGDFYVAPTATGTGDGLSAANAMSWTTHAAQSAATLSGKTVVVMPGTFSTKTLSVNGNASTVTYIPRDVSNPPVFDQLTISNCSKLTVRQIKLASSAWSSVSNASNPCVLFSGTNGVLTFDRCAYKGNYRGDINAEIDVVNELPEYASVAATMAAGAVTALTVTHSYVGDLMAPGTYALTLAETGGTGFSATMTVTNTTLGGITGNHITSTTLTNGGSGYAMILDEAARLTWTGQHRMFEYLVEAMRSAGGSSLANLSITDCTMSDVRNMIKITAPTGTFIVAGNWGDRIYESGISVGLGTGAAPPVTTFSDNLGTRFFYKSSDAGNPHGGFLRPSMNSSTPSDWIIDCARNIYVPGSSRGAPYFALFADNPAGVYYRTELRGNMGLSNGGATGFSTDGLRDSYFNRNTWVRYDPNDADTASVSVTLPAPSQSGNMAGKSYAANNIAENLTNSATTKIIDTGNVTLGTDPGAAAYNAVFVNPTSLPTTKAAALAAFAPLVAYAGKGAGGSDGYLDYTNKTYDKTLEPTFVNFDSLLNQTTSTAVSSAWCRVLGGPDSQIWSVTGGTAQVADDASGTGATTAATSGTVARGKFMRVNQTTSASGSTTTTATLTINGYDFDFAAATQSVAVFATVDNQSTAYSTSGAPTTATGLKRFIFAFRFKPDAVATNMNFICDSTAAGIRLFAASAAAYRWQFMSGVITHRSSLAPTTGWETHLMAIDLTKTVDNQVSKWYCNGVNVPIGATSTIDVTGTLSKGTVNFIASALGLFARPDGTNLMDGQGAFAWGHWGDGTIVLPDISDPAVQNMFSADNINLTNGSGPLGFQPKMFFYGANAAAWNTSLANKGSEPMTMAKIAGTYA